MTGVSTRTSNAQEMDPASARLPRLWSTFFREGHGARVEGAAIYGVYSEYESDVDGEYTVLIGGAAESPGHADVPASVTIPAGEYLVFTSDGEVPALVQDGWRSVWEYFASENTLDRAYTADFELYRNETPNRVEIYIAVRG